MPGIGKTTLAKKVYEHLSITRYFHVRAWYCISQVYEKLNLLLSILHDVTGKKIQGEDVEDIEMELYKSLKGKRYLVVIDDIWSIEPWNNIRKSFPDDCNGSRILFTSRIREVALKANPRSDPHNLRSFSYEESWELLKNKVFKHRSYPPELQEIGKRIAGNCKGLPLAVVVIAGILRTTQSEDQWRQISESLDEQVVSGSRKFSDVLELSYKHLPGHLKPCFLYLGAFPEDKEIPVRKLVRLWIAEGLVQKTQSESSEEVAEGYLKDLVSRSLVLVAKNKCNRGIKSCHLHDLWHQFSIEKAKDEKFLLLSQNLVDPEQYRHCFYCSEKWFYGWMPNYPYVRSLLCFPTDRSCPYHYNLYSSDLSVLPYILNLLRVLDLECISLGHQFPKIEFLVHLRYLSIRGSMNHIPSSVGKLWRLETFIVKRTEGAIKLPGILLEMAYLRHLYVNDWAVFELPDTFQPEKSLKSDDGIEKLSTLWLRHGDGTTEKVIKRIRNLRKLKCMFLETWDDSRHCNRFPVLDLLSELESLNVTYVGRVQQPYALSFPLNLKKLTLSGFGFPWSEISKIGRGLPKLEVLKLLVGAFEGPRWDVTDDEFCSLKVLKLESLDIMEWDASPDAFPCLEQLLLHSCDRLEEIPSSFGELATLRMIQVQWCGYSATEAAKKIQEEQEDLGSDGLKVLIQSSHYDSAPAS